MKTTLALLSLCLVTSPAFANGGSSTAGAPAPHHSPTPAVDDPSKEILNHPVVVSIEKLLNEKHDNQCVSPSAPQDITWRCLGAIPQVHEPVITPSSCFFSLVVKCPTEMATVEGTTTSYFLNVPQGSDIKARPTDKLVIINGVSIDPTN